VSNLAHLYLYDRPGLLEDDERSCSSCLRTGGLAQIHRCPARREHNQEEGPHPLCSAHAVVRDERSAVTRFLEQKKNMAEATLSKCFVKTSSARSPCCRAVGLHARTNVEFCENFSLESKTSSSREPAGRAPRACGTPSYHTVSRSDLWISDRCSVLSRAGHM
jgi:hypothetical protein